MFITHQIFFTTLTRAILKIGENPHLEDIRSHDTYRPISLERKHLMDYKGGEIQDTKALNLSPNIVFVAGFGSMFRVFSPFLIKLSRDIP